jgi:hypothetical protein
VITHPPSCILFCLGFFCCDALGVRFLSSC